MSDWTDRIDKHTVWQQMQMLGPAIDQALACDGIEPPIIEGLDRIRTILTFAGKRLAGADRQLISATSLDAIAGGLQQATSEVKRMSQMVMAVILRMPTPTQTRF